MILCVAGHPVTTARFDGFKEGAGPGFKVVATADAQCDPEKGRKAMEEIRHHGGPMLRVKRDDLADRGVERHLDRVVGVTRGLPTLADGTVVDAANVIWATGFAPRFDWIDLPVVGDDGWPREYRGVASDVEGLFFCGLAFQYAFASMVLPGVGRDAAYVAGQTALGME